MTAYDAGTAYLQVFPSFRGVDGLITAEVKKWNEQVRRGLESALPEALRAGARSAGVEGAKAGDEFGGSFARTVKTRIEAALKSLPKVELRADSSDAEVKIAAIRAELEDLHSKRVGIDIDEGLALAQLQRLQAELDRLGTEDPSISVRINAARASEELAAIQAEVNHLDGETATVHVRVDRDSIPSVGGLPGGAGLGGFGLAEAGVAAAPLAVPFGAAAVGLGAGVTSALGAGAAGLAVLGLGLSGVSKAVDAVAAANTKAGSAATASGAAQIRAALAVQAAERGVKSAQDALVNARANAADAAIVSSERVQSALAAQAAAERNLSTAQQAQKDAQQALTDARKAAQQQIQDLTQAVADGQLSQRQAELDVSKAQLHLQGVNSNPLSTQIDREQAQLDYDTAVQRQKDLATQQQRTIDAQKAAVKAGVDGSAAVVSAQRGVVAANQAVADAYTGIKTAAQGVADAQRAQAAQARQSAYAIQQAQNGILAAQAAVLSAQLQSQTAGDAVNQRLTAMSAPLKAFATFINDTIKPAFAGLRDAIQASLLPQLQAGLTALLPALPGLTRFVSGLAKVMGDLFVEASKALTSPFWTDFFGFVSRVAAPTIDTLAHIIGNLVEGFAGLLQAFWPVSKGIGDGILGLTQRFADFGKHLGSNSSFQAFLAYVKREGPAVAHFFGGFATLLGHLIEALAPLGALMLDMTNKVLDLVNALGPTGLLLIIGAVGAAVAAFGGPELLIAAGVVALEAAVVSAYAHFKPFHDFIHDHVMPTLRTLADNVLAGVRDAWAQVSGAIQRNKPELQQILHAFKSFMDFIVDRVLPILGPALKNALRSVGAQISVVIDVVGRLVRAFNDTRSGIDSFVGFVAKLPARIKSATSHMWDGIVTSFKSAINAVIRIWNDLSFSLKVPKSAFGIPIPGGGHTIGIDTPDIPPLRALGGPVVAGNPYWVGDGGTPELFVPGASGQILNLKQVAAAISGLSGGSVLNHTQMQLGGSNVGPSVGEYHQHFHRYPEESAAHAAMIGNQRLLHALSNR